MIVTGYFLFFIIGLSFQRKYNKHTEYYHVVLVKKSEDLSENLSEIRKDIWK